MELKWIEQEPTQKDLKITSTEEVSKPPTIKIGQPPTSLMAGSNQSNRIDQNGNPTDSSNFCFTCMKGDVS